VSAGDGHCLLLRPDREAEYCDEPVCVCVCVCVCLCLSVHEHIVGTTRPIFTNVCVMLPMAVTRSSSGGVMIRYVLPGLWIMS